MSYICELLKGGLCTPLNEPCFTPKNKSNCGWHAHHNWLQLIPGEPQINAALKKKIFPEARARWKDYAKNRTGGRSMTARPFEDSLKEEVDNYLKDLDIQIYVRNRRKLSRDLSL